MKVGDLVELSAYGKKIQILERLQGDVGIVMESYFDCAHVKWTSVGFRHNNRRDIKKVRVK